MGHLKSGLYLESQCPQPFSYRPYKNELPKCTEGDGIGDGVLTGCRGKCEVRG